MVPRAIRARTKCSDESWGDASTVVCMWAFSDESERSGVMLLAVVLLEPGEVDAARRRMRELLRPGQRRVTPPRSPTPDRGGLARRANVCGQGSR